MLASVVVASVGIALTKLQVLPPSEVLKTLTLTSGGVAETNAGASVQKPSLVENQVQAEKVW